MGGGLMQLVAYGAQDQYLTGNPQITFFKIVYRRYTNFSIESIQQTFSGTPDFGRKLSCSISRNGDLMYKTYLQVTLPQINCETSSNNRFRWLNWIGHILVKTVDIEIGGQQVDKHYSEWLHIWNELTQVPGKQEGYANMVGNVPRLTQVVKGHSDSATNASNQNIEDTQGCIPETTIYIPLQFWFCKNPGLALPLIALQYHEVKINVEFRESKFCYWATGKYTITPPQLKTASLYVDYIYLDTEERRRFTQVNHEYLIDQLQFRGSETVNSVSNKVKLSFNHPVKELVWVVQPDENVDITATQNFGGLQYYNFTDQLDVSYYSGTPGDPLGGGMVGGQAASGMNYPWGLPLVGNGIKNTETNTGTEYIHYYPDAGSTTGGGIDYASGGWGGIMAPQITSTYNSTPTTLTSSNLPLFDFGSNPIVTAKLQLNGHDRFSEREGRYFNLVQPYQHHSNIPATGINVYSFSLNPEDHQPSGTCNFSRIDVANLILTLTDKAVKFNKNCKVRVYASNYNILRITSGMGGVTYSN